MNVTQISLGRYHHFHLARQLQRNGVLEALYTGYPHFKLKDEQGIPPGKIKSFPWVRTPYMMRGRLGLDKWEWLNKEWEWLDQQTIDHYTASKIIHPTILVALSASGLNAGIKAKSLGGYYICDRGSSHISFQNEILKEEYRKWGFKFCGVDPRIIQKEELEYETCDTITIPSEFVKRSFLEKGIPESKLTKVVYGARLERFKKVAEPEASKFTILWVGAVNIRKGFMYLLKAFQSLKHPHKELIVIGNVEPEIKQLLNNEDISGIQFLGTVDNGQLPKYYSTAHVFVLPSIEDGFGMVMGEALGCGCPVIATNHTGAEDLFEDGKEGFIVPVRSVELLKNRLQLLMDDTGKQKQMADAGIEKVKSIGGWNSYGDEFTSLIERLQSPVTNSAIIK